MIMSNRTQVRDEPVGVLRPLDRWSGAPPVLPVVSGVSRLVLESLGVSAQRLSDYPAFYWLLPVVTSRAQCRLWPGFLADIISQGWGGSTVGIVQELLRTRSQFRRQARPPGRVHQADS